MQRVKLLKRRRRKRVPLNIRARHPDAPCTGRFNDELKRMLRRDWRKQSSGLCSRSRWDQMHRDQCARSMTSYMVECQKLWPLDGVEPMPHDDDDGDGDQLVPA